MKLRHITFLFVLSSILLITASAFSSTNLTGAGATFPTSLYSKWADSYQKKMGAKINYQGIGSSAGIKQIIANTVDFAASDIPLTEKQLLKNNLFQFPTVIGGIVLAINIPGIKSDQLILDGKVLGDIYLGKIKKWNDPKIIALNPEIKMILPDQDIAVVRRADGSGTTFVFTHYLSKKNPEWKAKIGEGSNINWPIGLGGKGNDGVAAFVQRLPGSIGYVEYSYAKQNNLAYTRLMFANNRSITPNLTSFESAAKDVDWTHSFAQDLTDQKGDNSWPITTATFILLKKTPKNTDDRRIDVIKFFDWAYRYGAKEAHDLDYATLPDSVINQIRNVWETQL
ncbi:phosphate ABC transporter substrate-binding protein PstS [Candidatus Williamhamiltonella defendens]|uniref:phosphate ABC transporter substrate-binding protein PstS n=1 Tax=Candidatus Williamhamiltonella defendens TaxID=138072 RepID=UPI00130E168F|nr:phosphate ABC transporter substrate-binding protein PstS [Candidatus Hamiltonella defensa]